MALCLRELGGGRFNYAPLKDCGTGPPSQYQRPSCRSSQDPSPLGVLQPRYVRGTIVKLNSQEASAPLGHPTSAHARQSGAQSGSARSRLSSSSSMHPVSTPTDPQSLHRGVHAQLAACWGTLEGVTIMISLEGRW
jgi:hypothetical protein